jgi:tripartite-type tricarboxylate transporter receptor subunit TctC
MSSNLALLALTGACLVAPSTGFAASTDYPVKPITVVVAFPPGAPEDFIVRLIADPFQAVMKEALIAENHAGAGGNIGAELVARAPTDGYTLLATIDTVVTINPSLYRKLSFKPQSDLRPVIYLASTAQTLVCHPSVPVKTVADLIAYAKTHSIDYASGGQGTPGHMAMELFMAATATKMNHIPYKGPGPATQDILAGVVPCGFLATPVVMPHVRGGKLIALGVTSAKRMAMAPEIPTIAESGVPGYEASFGETLLAPRDTPDAIVKQLNAALTQILQRPDVRDRMLAVSLDFTPNSPGEAAARLKAEAVKWHAVVDRLGLLLD